MEILQDRVVGMQNVLMSLKRSFAITRMVFQDYGMVKCIIPIISFNSLVIKGALLMVTAEPSAEREE